MSCSLIYLFAKDIFPIWIADNSRQPGLNIDTHPMQKLLALFALPLLVNTFQDYTFEWRYSLYAPYVNSEGQSAHWNIDALINNHHHIQLTPDLPGRSGNVFSKEVQEK